MRKLTDKEKSVVLKLLSGAPAHRELALGIDNIEVIDMDDGGMGSIRFMPQSTSGSSQRFGKQIAQGKFFDRDNVLVSLTLNIDTEGRLYELDSWKVNFDPLIAWPEDDAISLSPNPF